MLFMTWNLIYVGYVQGMSDLLSPILFVMDNEVDAFWCFVGFMELVVSSYKSIFHVHGYLCIHLNTAAQALC